MTIVAYFYDAIAGENRANAEWDMSKKGFKCKVSIVIISQYIIFPFATHICSTYNADIIAPSTIAHCSLTAFICLDGGGGCRSLIGCRRSIGCGSC